MPIVLSDLLQPAEAAVLAEAAAALPFEDGAPTAGAVARAVKDNEQAADGVETLAVTEKVMSALMTHPGFQAGFSDIEIVDVGVTSLEEQRRTSWMTFHSLKEFLDPDDATRTIEGFPSPRRAILTANLI